MSSVGTSESTIASTAGRIFLKNLDQAVDNLRLYEMFSVFGTIVSCKVSVDEQGRSRGYAFVHFETKEAAQKAVLEGNGMEIAGKKVLVQKFKTPAQLLEEIRSEFTNVFVKIFGEELDDDKLKKIFEKFGDITSCVVMRDANKKSKGFGFVAFKNAEDAEKAVAEMHLKTLEGTERQLFVCRAQKKSERQEQLRRQFEQPEDEELQDSEEAMLYVRNINDAIDDEGLTKMFTEFGKVTSVKIWRCENGRSRGKGFVCFEKVDDAKRAQKAMNSKIIGFKTLYVAFARSLEDRIAQLTRNMNNVADDNANKEFPVGPMWAPGQNLSFPTNASSLQNRQVFLPEATFVTPAVTVAPRGYKGIQAEQQIHSFAVPNYGSVPKNVSEVPFTPGNVRPQQFSPGSVVAPHFLSTSGFGGPFVPMQSQAVFELPQTCIYPTPSNVISIGSQFANQQRYCHPSRPLQGNIDEEQEPTTYHMSIQAHAEEQKEILGERKFPLADKKHVSFAVMAQSEMDRQQA